MNTSFLSSTSMAACLPSGETRGTEYFPGINGNGFLLPARSIRTRRASVNDEELPGTYARWPLFEKLKNVAADLAGGERRTPSTLGMGPLVTWSFGASNATAKRFP